MFPYDSIAMFVQVTYNVTDIGTIYRDQLQ